MRTRIPTAEDDRLTRVRDGDAEGGPVELPPELERDYEATGQLGAGAMGLVLSARERTSGRKVAIKLLKRPDSRAALDRFRREALLVAKIKHRHVVEIYKTGTAGESPYMVMELVEGGTLRDRLSQGRLSPDEAVGITCQLLEGLQACHEFGVVHRDVKPENILMTAGGWVKLSDLGVAKDYSSSKEGLTNAGELIGTPHYMAPEVLKGATAGASADLYSAGVVLFEMLTNELPFGSIGLFQLFTAHNTQVPRPLSELAPNLPPDLHETVMACLARRPADRPTSARDLAVRLGRCVTRLPRAVARTTVARRRAAVLPWLIVLVLLVGVVGMTLNQYPVTWWTRAPEPVPSPTPVSVVAQPSVSPTPAEDFDSGPAPVVSQQVSNAALETGDKLRDQGQYDAAREIFLRRAARGDGGAEYRLGLMGQLGEGTPPDPAAARTWYQRAAGKGIAEAQNNLAEMLRLGQGGPPDLELALRWYLLAADGGLVVAKENVDGLFRGGQVFLRPRALGRYRNRARRGDPWCNTLVGLLVQYGRGTSADPQLAAMYFRTAARRNEPVAEWHLAHLGEGQPPGTTWLQRAADHGSGDAANEIGEQLAMDPARASEAVTWWKRAAESGHCAAQRHLAEAYRTGNGIAPDPALAELYMRTAALGGDAEAQRAVKGP